MRRVAEPDRIQRFMTALAVKATRQARLYFTGGATSAHGDVCRQDPQKNKPADLLDRCGG